MKIINNTSNNSASLEIGDIILYGGYYCIITRVDISTNHEDIEFPYVLVNLSDGKAIDSYNNLEVLESKHDFYKANQCELIIN